MFLLLTLNTFRIALSAAARLFTKVNQFFSNTLLCQQQLVYLPKLINSFGCFHRVFYPVNIYLFKINNSFWQRCKIYLKLMKTPEQRYWHRFALFSTVSIVNFEQINIYKVLGFRETPCVKFKVIYLEHFCCALSCRLNKCTAWIFDRSSSSHMFFKMGVLKVFTDFTGRHLCWSHFLIKLQAWRPATLLKKDSNTGVL